MAPRCELTTEPAAARWLRRAAPWLVLLAIGAGLMVPGILVERPAGDQPQRPTLTATSMAQDR